MKAEIPVGALISLLLVAAPAPTRAQELHRDPSSGGATGLFTVVLPTVLEAGEFALGLHFSAIAHAPGDSNVETIGAAGAFVFGAADRLEIFGSFEPAVRIHRDYQVELRLGVPPADAPLVAPRLDDHPLAVGSWSTGVGDVRLGAKYKLLGAPRAYDGVAVVGVLKLPTSSTNRGVGTGEPDLSFGVSAATEAAQRLAVSGYIGGTLRGSPAEVEVGHSLDFAFGIQVPTRFWISAIMEMNGRLARGPEAIDRHAPARTPRTARADPVILLGGVRLSHDSGVDLDLAYTYNANFALPSAATDVRVRPEGAFIKVSYTNSRREPVVYIGAEPMDLPPVNRPPTLSCRAERTSVRVGESVRLFADVNDPDGDGVTVTWNTQAGTINPREGETVTWSSQGVRPGSGPVTARASDGYGGTADCQLTLTVTAPPPPPEPRMLTFTCSEFPSGNTRIDNRCKAILDDVALQLRQNPSATAVITGHSDSAGAADVNERMAQERADNAETYLVDTHGIDGGRIDTASAGSSQPIADNETAEGRLQNRRIVVVVTIPAR